MIARVSIAPAGLSGVSNAQGRVAKLDHSRLLDRVRKHGQLVFESADAATRFIRFLRSDGDRLPPGVAARWMTLMTDFRKDGRVAAASPALGTSPDGAGSFDVLSGEWAGTVDVAILDYLTAATLGIPDDEGFLVAPESGFEAVASDVAEACNHFTYFEKLLASGALPHGESRQKFWDEVLGPMWRASRRAVVVDRYLFKKILKRPNGEHLSWLVDNLARGEGKPGHITLIGEALRNENMDGDTILDRLEAACSGGRVRSVQVVLVPARDRGGSYVPHDRHIRFDAGAVLLGAGLDRLSYPAVRDENGLNWSIKWDNEALSTLRESEERCRHVVGAEIGTREPSASARGGAS